MVNICMRWFCFEDPYERQCSKMVETNNKLVQCKRVGKHYVKHKNGYYCDKHHDVKEVENVSIQNSYTKKTSTEQANDYAYSRASTTSSNDE